ncbi:MAG TPA: methyltransferase domain-containing protein [Gemmatimonadaceae bacterium]|nr:methyltransferase domain-containing protein [Gemmatimonadaceae bacterium]
MNKPRDAGSAPTYVLGHSDRELARLTAQARLIDPITRRFFRDAGIAPGMRVLDVGSGAGDVAFLAADLVGDTGEVVGADRVPAALEAARARATSRSQRNVSFRDGDPAEMAFERPFDVAIGRYVLQFQSEPAAMLRKIARHVRPEGLIVFHEIDHSGVGSSPPAPTYDRCCRWVIETLRRHGTETQMGIKLHSTFVAAGLPAPRMRLEALLGGGANGSDCTSLVAQLVGTLLPEMERLGVATAADVGLETLAERMSKEAFVNSSVILGHWQIGAWCRVPKGGVWPACERGS